MTSPTAHHQTDFTRVFDIPAYQQKKYPQIKALNSFRNGKWESISIENIRLQVDCISGWLLEKNLKKGQCIAVVPKNGSPEWMMLDLASQQIGLITVPIHPTSNTEEMEFILKETNSVICVTANFELSQKIQLTREKVQSLQYVYHLEKGHEGFLSLLEIKPGIGSARIEEVKSNVQSSDVLAIMYTSGTTGISKGAVLTHDNVVSNIKSILTALPLQAEQRVLSFLPYSHIFERTSSYAYVAFGAQVFFCESIDRLTADFKVVRPHFCTTVPRTLEKMYDFLLEQKMSAGRIRKFLISKALNIGEKYQTRPKNGILYSLKLILARFLVLNRWKKSLGGNLRFMAVGAAALRPEIGRLFSAAGIQTLSGYGMTEASPYISVNRNLPGLNRFGTVGIPLPGMEIKLDDSQGTGEGEIWIKGPNVMQGYFNRPELNAEVFSTDGWFKTGDIGTFVDKRFLAITGRKKDIFKTSAGKYVTPQPIENLFVTSPFIVQCLILGFSRPYVTAILVPNFRLLKSWCEDNGIHWTSPQFMVHNIKVIAKFQEEIDRLNESLQGFEKVRDFILSDEEWTVENKDLTASFKLRRSILMDKYSAEIEKMYRK